jgi:rare lipoprotein A
LAWRWIRSVSIRGQWPRLIAAAFVAALLTLLEPAWQTPDGSPVLTASAEAAVTTQVGVATWYGPRFHGRRTASGEVFNQYALVAAHRTLKMHSRVRVTNLENGRSVVVRVVDRGPHRRGKLIDLSRGAARKLGFLKKGTAKVRLEVLSYGK